MQEGRLKSFLPPHFPKYDGDIAQPTSVARRGH